MEPPHKKRKIDMESSSSSEMSSIPSNMNNSLEMERNINNINSETTNDSEVKSLDILENARTATSSINENKVELANENSNNFSQNSNSLSIMEDVPIVQLDLNHFQELSKDNSTSNHSNQIHLENSEPIILNLQNNSNSINNHEISNSEKELIYLNGNIIGDNENQNITPIVFSKKSQINQSDLIRLMIQYLYSTNYVSAANNLQKITGIKLYTNDISKFRNLLLKGDYLEILSNTEFYIRKTLNIQNEFYFKSIVLLILKQQYLEYLENNDIENSLIVLREKLTPLLEKENSDELHQLASLLLCQSKDDLYEHAGWKGKENDSRLKLVNDIQKYVDPRLLIPENHLETLLTQAIEYQNQHLCTLQNPSNYDPSLGISLLQREISPQDAVPDSTYAVLKHHESEVWNVQFSHNGKYLASVGKDKMCFVYNVNNFSTPYRTLKGHDDAIYVVLWSPNDKYLLTTSQDRKTKVWNVESGECIATFDRCTTACAWYPNSEEILCAGGNGDRYVNKYNIFTKQKQALLYLAHKIQDLDLSSDGSRLVIVNTTKKFFVYNLNDINNYDEFYETDFVTSVKLSPCGRYALLNISLESSSSKVSRLDMWDLNKKEKVREYIGHVQSMFVIRSCFGGNNGCFIVSGSEKNEILVWLRFDGKLLTTLSGHSSAVCGVACNPKYPSMFASASDDHTVRVYHCSKNPFLISNEE